jgi:hypothetical protein
LERHTETRERDVRYDSPSLGKGGETMLSVDGHALSRKKIPRMRPRPISIDENYELLFYFTGRIDKLRFKLGPSPIKTADKRAVENGAKKSDN